MNILIVSECEKNALKETRRILDQFAERYGVRTWRTTITQAGLETLKTLLKKTARKNTAVACHWLRSRTQSELLWVVGNTNSFNERGVVPTNITTQNILRQEDENDWHTATDIKLLAEAAALFHDFGKANVAFQKKLISKEKPEKEAYRHEWMSLQLFVQFVGDSKNDHEWLDRLMKADVKFSLSTIEHIITPFKSILHLPLASAIAWLIVTHHFLPFLESGAVTVKFLENWSAGWNRSDKEFTEAQKKLCWIFKKGTPFNSQSWCEKAIKLAQLLQARSSLLQTNWLDDPYSLHLARLSLMLGDHYYSSLDELSDRVKADDDYQLFANTHGKTGELKQTLDEHLIGVAYWSRKIARQLPKLALPSLPLRRAFEKRSKGNFSWQNKAYDLAHSLQKKVATQGFFGINMASTGCGKTLANAKIMYALSDPQRGCRLAIALGLRVLTLQTGEAYRQHLHLSEDELAVVIGSSAAKKIFDVQKSENKETGSESEEALLEREVVFYEGNISDKLPWLKKDSQTQKLLSAPILVCTIDQLINASEGIRGGKNTIPMLRLLTSDLVLDEPDDFDIEDLYALTRLVYYAGLLGSKVLLSSATLPPSIVKGLFDAYCNGRAAFQKARGISNIPVNICCAWFDEHSVAAAECSSLNAFETEHVAFIEKRTEKIQSTKPSKKAIIKPFSAVYGENNFYATLSQTLANYSDELHEKHHTIDPHTKKRVSFGVIRFANISPLVGITQAWLGLQASADHHVFLCCYHSRHPLIVRSHIEATLDKFLTRHNEMAVFQLPEYQELIRSVPEKNILFIVLATPVAEVGRDHDYDWAIIEPSSMRSIIQLAGRIQRHRQKIVTSENIYLLETNVKSLKNSAMVTYNRPGFETKQPGFKLQSKNLNEILRDEQYKTINSIARINETITEPQKNLVDLEHARLNAVMLGTQADVESANLFWKSPLMHLTGQTQFNHRFRKNDQSQQRFVLCLEEFDLPQFHPVDDKGIVARTICSDIKYQEIGLVQDSNITVWAYQEYEILIDEWAEKIGGRVEDIIKTLGFVDLPLAREGQMQPWHYHPWLGVYRKK